MPRLAYHFDAATRQHVATLAAAGLKRTEIARALGCHRNTLRKYVREECAVGAAKARMEIAVAMYEAALKGSVSAARYYLSGALGRHRG